MNDISKDKDYQEFFAGIKELAKGLMQIRERDYQQSQYRHNQVANPLQQIIEEFTKVSHSGCFVYKGNAFLLIFGLKHQTLCRFILIFGHNYVTL